MVKENKHHMTLQESAKHILSDEDHIKMLWKENEDMCRQLNVVCRMFDIEIESTYARAFRDRLKAFAHSQGVRLEIITRLNEQVVAATKQTEVANALAREAVRQRDESEKKVKFLKAVLEKRAVQVAVEENEQKDKNDT